MLSEVRSAKADAVATRYLTTSEAACRLGCCVQTLRNWRGVAGLGPRYTRFGARIRYSLADIEAYEGARTFGSRDEEKSAA